MKIAALRWPLACAALMFCAAASWGAPLTIEEVAEYRKKILPFQIGETVGGSLQMSGKHLWKNGSMFRGYAVII